MNTDTKQSSTGNKGRGSPTHKRKMSLARHYQQLADCIEFQDLPFIKDPWQRGILKRQVARNRDRAIMFMAQVHAILRDEA